MLQLNHLTMVKEWYFLKNIQLCQKCFINLIHFSSYAFPAMFQFYHRWVFTNRFNLILRCGWFFTKETGVPQKKMIFFRTLKGP